jgi:hypothetical protein
MAALSQTAAPGSTGEGARPPYYPEKTIFG